MFPRVEMDGRNIATDFGASSSFSQFRAAPDASCGWQGSHGDNVNESQFDLNTGTVPSSQAPSSFEFGQIPEDDNFDINRVHLAARAGFAPVPDQSQPRSQQRSRQQASNVTKVIRKQWESSQVEALLECKKQEAEELEMLVGREQIVSSEMKWKRIHSAMLAKGVQADPSQLRNKWESVLGTLQKSEGLEQ